VAAALAESKRGIDELLPEQEWVAKLSKSAATGVPLRIKLGWIRPRRTSTSGTPVVLNKMRQLQDLGHTVIFLIGDFTSMIGDPSGRNATRPPLTARTDRGERPDLLRAGEPGARPGPHRRFATTPSGAIRSARAA
jgi:tyrosyl-tRNA synthetase